RVRVASRGSGTVWLKLAGEDGRALSHVRRLRVQPGRSRTTTLSLTATGRRRFGRCGRTRVALVISGAGGRSRGAWRPTIVDPVRCAPLRWAPPVLKDPQTIELGRGFSNLRLEPGRDYILRLPPGRKLGGSFVEGGRNVVIVGGHVTLPAGTTSDEQRRGLYFKNQTGTVHVEGVLIDGSGGGDGDGIALSAPLATVQLENVRIVGLRGSEGATHADVVQPWGGVRELRIDRLSGSSHFQGLQLPVAMGPIESAAIRFADLRALVPLAGRRRPGGGHMLWLTPSGSCAGYPTELDHVYVMPRPGRELRNSVWPGVGDGSQCAGVEQGGAVRWPRLPVRGDVQAGAPVGGDYVPRWNVGERYRSPGYAAGGDAAAFGAAVARTLRLLACLTVVRSCTS
ncbi:MAG TPA: hypothetical protein VI111_00790, partial [Thermoleophilaceae bacterium]